MEEDIRTRNDQTHTTGQDITEAGTAEQDATGQDTTEAGTAEQDTTERDITEQDATGRDITEAGTAEQDAAEHDTTGQEAGKRCRSHGSMTIVDIAQIGILSAAVYAASAFLQIPIPTIVGSTRLHMGNVICLLAGMLLGPTGGGLAAGIGSMLFDLTNPAYVTSAPFTFVFKFAMAWLCGRLTHPSAGGKSRKKTIIPCGGKQSVRMRYLSGSAAGSFVYICCYLSKNFVEHRFVLGLPMQAVMLTIAQKALVSGVNAVIACAAAVPLGLALRARKIGGRAGE